LIDKTGGVPASAERFEAIAGDPAFELHVLCPERWLEHGIWYEATPGEKSGYVLHSAPVVFPGFYARSFYESGVRRILSRLRPDLIHLLEEPHSLFMLQALHFRSRCVPESPVLFYTWENIFRGFRYPARVQFVYRYTDRRAHREAQAGLCATPQAQEVLKRKGFPGPTEVIPYGVSREFLTAPEEQPPGPEGGPYMVGYVGRLLEMKGVDLLLSALPELPHSALEIVGEGSAERGLRDLALELGIENRVTFHGALPQGRLREVMSRLNCLVLPSRTTSRWSEQLGRVLLEAMALGIPVTGSRSGSIPYTIGKAGLLFEENDVAGLIKCIKQLHDDPSFARALGRRGRERVETEFTWPRFGRRVREFYRTQLGENG
jgi:glycosyltransferase involved in cell wall biosynthesis